MGKVYTESRKPQQLLVFLPCAYLTQEYLHSTANSCLFHCPINHPTWPDEGISETVASTEPASASQPSGPALHAAGGCRCTKTKRGPAPPPPTQPRSPIPMGGKLRREVGRAGATGAQLSCGHHGWQRAAALLCVLPVRESSYSMIQMSGAKQTQGMS